MAAKRKQNPRKLTPKQIKACEGYMQGKSMRVALLDAGYAEMFATKRSGDFLKSRQIAEYLRKRQEEQIQAARATEEFVQRKLVELIDSNDPELMKDALKILDSHWKWRMELQAKLKDIESKEAIADKQPQQITFNVVTSKDE